MNNLTNKKFDKLTVLEITDMRKNSCTVISHIKNKKVWI